MTEGIHEPQPDGPLDVARDPLAGPARSDSLEPGPLGVEPEHAEALRRLWRLEEIAAQAGAGARDAHGRLTGGRREHREKLEQVDRVRAQARSYKGNLRALGRRDRESASGRVDSQVADMEAALARSEARLRILEGSNEELGNRSRAATDLAHHCREYLRKRGLDPDAAREMRFASRPLATNGGNAK